MSVRSTIYGGQTGRWGRISKRTVRDWAITAAAVCMIVAGLVIPAVSQAPKTRLVLNRCRPGFEDRFTNLNVSATGPGTRWIAHTPWFGDFGDAQFTDPQPGFPFTSGPEGLTITAQKGPDDKWRSGLLSSTDPRSAGFSAQYGYFEMVSKFPPGKGTWPAFWLLTADRQADPDIEIDVVEYYGHWTDRYQATVTVRPKGGRPGRSKTHWIEVPAGSLTEKWHSYGVAVGRQDVVFYLDRQEVWRTPTPPEHQKPLGVLLNLALGSGWPIAETPNPSRMSVSDVAYYGDLSGCGVSPRAAGDPDPK
jgi:hypothetical protein